VPDQFTQYLKLTGSVLRRTGMDLVYSYSHRENDKWVLLSEPIARGFAQYTPLKGIMQTWDGDLLAVRQGGLPIVGQWGAPGKAAEYKAALDARVAQWDGAKPLFISGGINAWSWTPSDIAALAALLGDPYELVLGNTFFDLLNRVL
jgi:hypothetical protein